MDVKTFGDFQSFIYDSCGITLGELKESMVSARISKRLRLLNLSTPGEYLEYVKNDQSGSELIELLDAISTNVTSFYREAQHFTLMDTLMRQWTIQGQRRFRLWCAAASSGEEPYTIAMTLAECGALELDTKVLCTDISTKVLSQCQNGFYAKSRMNGVSEDRRKKWFQEVGDGWQIVPQLQNPLTIKRLNLAQPPFPLKGPLDIIMCRNVMIYFDNRVRQNLLDEFHRLLKPGGYLMVGHAESLTGLATKFKTIQPSVYQKVH